MTAPAQLTSSEMFWSITQSTQDFLIFEFRKFFGGLPPYLPPKFPLGVIPPDLLYIETAPGQPTDASKIVISDEENFDDRKIPCIILTGASGPTMELGLGQRGQKTNQTDEPNPDIGPPVQAATIMAGDMTTDFCAGQIVDSYILQVNDRLLINFQTDPTTNGVYIVQASGAPVRSADFDTSAQFLQWSTFQVLMGTINGGRYFSQDTPNNPQQPFVLGTTPLAYNDRGMNILRWRESVGAQEVTINIAIRAQTTRQRVVLAELVKIALADKNLIRGELEERAVMPMPPFVRDNGFSEEFAMAASTKMIYKADLAIVCFCQWNHRILENHFKVNQIVFTEVQPSTPPDK